MNWFYQAGIALYSVGVKLASFRHPKAEKMVKGHRLTMPVLAEFNRRCGDRKERIWIHAASLGEFEQGRPLIEKIRAERPDAAILLSFFSPSGMEVRKNYDKVDAVVYLPFDTKRNARIFIETLRPTMAVFVKYEFWGNYLTELKKHNIPTYLISGIFRPTQRFFKPFGGQFRRILGCFTGFYVQNETSRQLLESIGLTNVIVNGDTRLDRVAQIKDKAVSDPLLETFAETSGSEKILVAGSTWPPDETRLIEWSKSRPDWHFIIAPHEMGGDRLDVLKRQLGDGAWLLSDLRAYFEKNAALPGGLRHIIIDCFGLLATLYRYGSIAYVGGGFGVGIHNINEAAVYGIPVVFGPTYQKFQEAKDLIGIGGAFSVSSSDEMSHRLTTLADDGEMRRQSGEKAAGYIASSRGATDLIFRDLFERRR